VVRVIATYLVPAARTTIVAVPDGDPESEDPEDADGGDDADDDADDEDHAA
jgi:hypothetical protein